MTDYPKICIKPLTVHCLNNKFNPSYNETADCFKTNLNSFIEKMF